MSRDRALHRLRARIAGLLARLDLRDRVTLATAAVLAGGVALLSAGALLLLNGQLDRDVSAALSERADTQLAAVTQVDGRTVVRSTPDGVLDEQSWVFDTTGRALRRPPASAAAEAVAESLADVTTPTERDVGDTLRLRAEPARAEDGTRIGTVVVGVSRGPYERTEHLAVLAIAFLDVCIVVVGALLARRAVGKALQPVADMTAQAADWSEHDLDRRFGLGPPRDELTALSATLDGLLARIAASVRREQRFSAELAHELRTPLTGVRGEAELALRSAGLSEETRAALERIVTGTDRMRGVIDALLTAARGEGEGAAGGVGDAAAAARAAVEAIEPVAAAGGVRVELATGSGVPRDHGNGTTSVGGRPGAIGRGPSAPPGDPALTPLRVSAETRLVEQTLAPLLDNAVRHARGVVAVRVERAGGEVLLHVEDDGAGFDPVDLERPFAPGASGAGGSGLGLPLARRLARSAGGEVTAVAPETRAPGQAGGGRSAPAGGHVVLRLPAVG
jgi:signal transduction histidine kinase